MKQFGVEHFSKHGLPEKTSGDAATTRDTLFVPLAWGNTFHKSSVCPQLDDGLAVTSAMEVEERHMQPCLICTTWTDTEREHRENTVVMQALSGGPCYHTKELCPLLRDGHECTTIQETRKRKRTKCRECAQQEQCSTWELSEPPSPTVTMFHPGGGAGLPMSTLRQLCMHGGIDSSGDSATLTTRLMQHEEREQEKCRKVYAHQQGCRKQNITEPERVSAVHSQTESQTHEDLWDAWDNGQIEHQTKVDEVRVQSSDNGGGSQKDNHPVDKATSGDQLTTRKISDDTCPTTRNIKTVWKVGQPSNGIHDQSQIMGEAASTL